MSIRDGLQFWYDLTDWIKSLWAKTSKLTWALIAIGLLVICVARACHAQATDSARVEGLSVRFSWASLAGADSARLTVTDSATGKSYINSKVSTRTRTRAVTIPVKGPSYRSVERCLHVWPTSRQVPPICRFFPQYASADTTPPVVVVPPDSTPGGFSGVAELPRATVDVTMPTPLRSYRIGANLQTALDTARRGDRLLLAPSAVYTGNFVLRAKSGTGWIVLQTDTVLPPPGTRVNPVSAQKFARIVTPNSASAIATAGSGDASYYRLTGLEITTTAPMTYDLVRAYNGDAKAVADIPKGLIVDRSYVHGTTTGSLQRCIMLNGAASAVVDSWVADCHAKGTDAQAIIVWLSPGPFLVRNNHLEGSGENVMFGGSDPIVAGVVPSDITFQRNHVIKPLSWRDTTGYNPWTEKNLFEIKNAQRVLVEDNVFENNWADGQSGFALVMKSVNQSGGCNWCVAQDLTFRWNVLKNSPGGFNIGAQQNESGGTSIPLNGLVIDQFLFDSVGQSSQTGSRFLFQLLQNLDSVSITHTTGLIQAGSITSLAGGVMSHFLMSQNLWANGQYGIKGDSKAPGSGSISFYMPTGIFSDNVIIGAPANDYPAGNLYPASLSLVPVGTTAGVDTVALAKRLQGVAP